MDDGLRLQHAREVLDAAGSPGAVVPPADGGAMTWSGWLAAARDAGLDPQDLDPAAAVARATGSGEEAGEAFAAAVEALKDRVVAAMAEAGPDGGARRVLAAVAVSGDVLAVLLTSLARRKDGTLVAMAREPGVGEVRYLWDGICLLRAALVRSGTARTG